MKKFSIFLMVAVVGFFQYCSSSKKTSTNTSTTTTTPVPTHASLTYMTNIQSTLIANCSPCHFPPRGNKTALDTYASAKENIGDIISRIKMNPEERGFMPFKHSKLSDSVINVFVQWKADGLMEK